MNFDVQEIGFSESWEPAVNRRIYECPSEIATYVVPYSYSTAVKIRPFAVYLAPVFSSRNSEEALKDENIYVWKFLDEVEQPFFQSDSSFLHNNQSTSTSNIRSNNVTAGSFDNKISSVKKSGANEIHTDETRTEVICVYNGYETRTRNAGVFEFAGFPLNKLKKIDELFENYKSLRLTGHYYFDETVYRRNGLNGISNYFANINMSQYIKYNRNDCQIFSSPVYSSRRERFRLASILSLEKISLKCPFHADRHPSACVYKNEKYGVIFKCFSTNCGHIPKNSREWNAVTERVIEIQRYYSL